MVLFDPRNCHARDADPVTSHNDRVRFASCIQIAAIHCFGILRPEFEDMAHFNSSRRLQLARTTGTALAFLGQFEIIQLRQRQIAPKIYINVVIIGLIGAAFKIHPIPSVMISDDTYRLW